MRPALQAVLARISAGAWPRASEYRALLDESGTDAAAAAALTSRYDAALKGVLVDALDPHLAAREERRSGEDDLLAQLRSFRLS